MESEPVPELKGGDVLLEDRPYNREVEATPGNVRMRHGGMDGEASLGAPGVDERPILLSSVLYRAVEMTCWLSHAEAALLSEEGR